MAKGARHDGRQARRVRTAKAVNNHRALMAGVTIWVDPVRAPPPLPPRAPPPPDELESLCAQLALDRASSFGIEKVSKLDLQEAVEQFNGRTMVEEAVARSHDATLHALLRGGVDPTVRPDVPTPDKAAAADAARIIIASPGDSQTVYWVREIIDARLRWREELDVHAQKALGPCVHCGGDPSTAPSGGVAYRCGAHAACEACAWHHAGGGRLHNDLPPRKRSAVAATVWVRCPECAPGTSARRPEDVPPDAATLLPSFGEGDDGELSPDDVRQRSLARYRSIDPQKAPNIDHFHAMPHHIAARSHIGITTAQRDSRMFEAATLGDAHRLCALVEAGCDVRCRDDAGRTPLLVASCYDNVDAVRLLLRCGARLDDVDHGGHTARDAAVARGCTEALALLDGWSAMDAVDGAGWRKMVQWMVHPRGWCGWRTQDDAVGGARSPTAAARAAASDGQRALASEAQVHVRLLDSPEDHLAYPAYEIDGAFDESFLVALEGVGKALPRTSACQGRGKGSKNTDALRIPYFDATAFVQRGVAKALAKVARACPSFPLSEIQPQMKFLAYDVAGEKLVPHTDLSKTSDETGRKTTHTFILYLTGAPGGGGETVLFDKLPKTHEWEAKAAEATDATALHGIYEASMETLCGGVLDRVEPRRGRLFVFPHDAPHAAMPVLVPPKLILRAEAY